jgi:hypothetical protein
VYIIYVNTQTTDRDIIMKEPNRKNRIDELEKEIKTLKERVTYIESYFKVTEMKEEPKTSFM